jgi:hypothetical protein
MTVVTALPLRRRKPAPKPGPAITTRIVKVDKQAARKRQEEAIDPEVAAEVMAAMKRMLRPPGGDPYAGALVGVASSRGESHVRLAFARRTVPAE